MANASRCGDMGSGHDACPPTTVSSCSGNVIIEGSGAARVGDSLVSHGCLVHPNHGRTISSGSSNVIVNNSPLARIGSSIDCGGALIEGASSVQTS